jgi:large subunit ribosomal protein L24
MRRKLKIKTGDIVKVIAGNQKGTQGKVLRVFANKNRAIVEGINVVKKHNKPNANNSKGGITEKELSIDISNISLITSDGQPTRVGFKIENDKKVRYSKKSDEVL